MGKYIEYRELVDGETKRESPAPETLVEKPQTLKPIFVRFVQIAGTTYSEFEDKDGIVSYGAGQEKTRFKI